MYTERRILVVGDMGELAFGSKQGDQSAWFVDGNRFAQIWAGDKPVFALASNDDMEKLGKVLKPAPVVLGSEGKRTLITNGRQAADATAASPAAPPRQR